MRIFRSSDAPVGPVDPATFLGRATVQRLAHDETGVPVGVYRVAFKRMAVTATISNLATPSSWPRANVTGTAPFRAARARTSL
jgi:hypothetical protein